MEATREEVPAWPSGLGIGAVYCPDCEEWTYDVIDGEVLMTLTRREMFGVTWLFIRALVGTWRCKR